MSASVHKQVKVLFLAWGYSIHARRRIQLFSEDPSFNVTVVSTFDYGFEGAENILLPSVDSFCGRMLSALRYRSDDLLFFRLLEDTWKVVLDMLTLARVVKDIRPDVLFLQTLLYPCYLSLLLPKSIPIIITFWNGDVTWWAKWDGIERLLKKNIVTWGVRRARSITVNSQAAFDACLTYGVTSEKIHLIRYPGVDMGRFYPRDKNTARQKLGLSGCNIVFAPRGLGSYLNSDIIVAAAALVAMAIPEVVFVFSCAVGQGDELDKHTRQAMSAGISSNCRWIAKIAWEEMPDYYNSADVMVSISSNDSLPNCMLEAMACGVPVIMGDIPQLQEWIVDGENGYFVPVRDPEILAERIIAVLQNRNQVVDTLISNAFDGVANHADSRKTIPMIKQLVNDTAKVGYHA